MVILLLNILLSKYSEIIFYKKFIEHLSRHFMIEIQYIYLAIIYNIDNNNYFLVSRSYS